MLSEGGSDGVVPKPTEGGGIEFCIAIALEPLLTGSFASSPDPPQALSVRVVSKAMVSLIVVCLADISVITALYELWF